MSNPIVTLRNLAMLLPLIGKEETRYYICGIHIEPHPDKGALLIATNGHAMGIIHDENATCEKPVTWKPNRVLTAACESYHPVTTYDAEGDSYTERSPYDGEMVELTPLVGEPIDGVFPNWRKLMPQEFGEREAACFDAGIAAQFERALLVDTGTTIMTRYFGGVDGNPAFIHNTNTPHFLGLIMPRTHGTESMSALPAWLNLTPSPPPGSSSPELAAKPPVPGQSPGAPEADQQQEKV